MVLDLLILLALTMMNDIEKLKSHWDRLGKEDPLWAILSHPSKVGGKWEINEFFSTGKLEISQLMEEIESLPILSINYLKALDFGCGVGRLTSALSDYFEEVVGIDISPSMIDLARELNRGNRKCAFINNIRPDLVKINDKSIDFVYSNITLQHIPPSAIVAYIKEFLRIVKNGGLVVFQLPSGNDWSFRGRILRLLPDWVARYLRKYLNKSSAPVSMYTLPVRVIRKVIDSAGGEIVYLKSDEGAGKGWVGYRYFVKRKNIETP